MGPITGHEVGVGDCSREVTATVVGVMRSLYFCESGACSFTNVPNHFQAYPTSRMASAGSTSRSGLGAMPPVALTGLHANSLTPSDATQTEEDRFPFPKKKVQYHEVQ